MRIKSINIKNLRSIKDETINFDDYTCLVGANGSGKSTILCAMNIFFREKDNTPTDLSDLCAEDFHNGNTDNPIKITVTFADLSDEAKQDFKDYCQQSKTELAISAIAKFRENKAEVRQYGNRLGIKEFKEFFEKYRDSAKADELKNIYENLCKKYTELPKANTKEKIYDALRKYEASHPDKCDSIPSEDQFYGNNKGKLLEKYIQWVYIPAVKDATQEQTDIKKNSALNKLLKRAIDTKIDFKKLEKFRKDTQNNYQHILEKNQSVLDKLSSTLKQRIGEWSHPGASLTLTWQQAPIDIEPFVKILAKEGDFESEIGRCGHGFQRSYLLALLQELAVHGNKNPPLLILGCEEPELFQYPPQARHLKGVFERISKDNSQIIISTHSPFFITGDNFENVRMVRRGSVSKECNVKQVNFNDISTRYKEVTGNKLDEKGMLAKINQILQPALNEMFFTNQLVFVEGYEDIAYIHTWIEINGLWDKFRGSGSYLVPTNGKSFMIKPTIIAQELNIPLFAIFDGDRNIKKDQEKQQHKKDNLALLKLFNADIKTPFPDKTVWGENFVMWSTNISDIVNSEFKKSINEDTVQTIKDEIRAEFCHAKNLYKNTLFIGKFLTLAKDRGAESESLTKLCKILINQDLRTDKR